MKFYNREKEFDELQLVRQTKQKKGRNCNVSTFLLYQNYFFQI